MQGTAPPEGHGHEAGAGRAAQPWHKHNSCPLATGRKPSLEDCLAREPKGSGQMLLPCGCPSVCCSLCNNCWAPAHPPLGSAHCV